MRHLGRPSALCWRTFDGRTITVREMTDVHLVNTITKLEIAAERETFTDLTLSGLAVREAAARLYPAYTYLVAERARRMEAEGVNARTIRLSVN